MIRVWFLITSVIALIYSLTVHPAAAGMQAPIVHLGDDIPGTVAGENSAAVPIPITQDGDIVQPPSYIPHVLPEDEAEQVESETESANEENQVLEVVPESSPPVPPNIPPPDEEAWLAAPEVGGNNQWYIPPEAYGSNAPTVAYGYSADVPLSMDADTLTEIRDGVNSIVFEISFCIAGVVVFLILKSVWPLFNSL